MFTKKDQRDGRFESIILMLSYFRWSNVLGGTTFKLDLVVFIDSDR